MAFNKTINFRCDENFEALLHKKMQESGLSSYSQFIREAVQKSTIKQRCQGIQSLIKEINKIGVNLNQISKYTHEKRVIDRLVLDGIENTYKQLNIAIYRFNHVS